MWISNEKNFMYICSVTVFRKMAVAYLLLGGNQGNVAQTFARAVSMLGTQGVHVRAASSLYASEPWGVDSGKVRLFLNQALMADTLLDPYRLLDTLLSVEQQLGRVRKPGDMSRVIDIDILFYGSTIVSGPGLEIPHPRLHLRKFALTPLMEIAPRFVHPVLGKTVEELLAQTGDILIVRKLGNNRRSDLSSSE